MSNAEFNNYHHGLDKNHTKFNETDRHVHNPHRHNRSNSSNNTNISNDSSSDSDDDENRLLATTITCNLPATKCSANNVATACYAGYYVNNGACVAECPVGYYIILPEASSCAWCTLAGASNCMSATYALACKSGYFLASGGVC